MGRRIGVDAVAIGRDARDHETGRGAFRLRAKWEQEDLGRGQWQIVVTLVQGSGTLNFRTEKNK